MTLASLLPELSADVEGALVRLGRGDLADRVRESPIAAWHRDVFVQATELHMAPGTREPGTGDTTVSLLDETGVSLELDALGNVTRIDVYGYEDVLARLVDLRQRRALFAGPGWRAVESFAFDIPLLQAFFDANPDYHMAVCGAPAGPGAAREGFEAMPPPEWPCTRKWMVLLVDGEGAVVGMADLLADLFSPGIWHVGLFIVATRLHGSGAAQAMYAGLEGWMRTSGARWSRLGVVEGNLRGERFWRQVGYREVRQRPDYPVGEKRHLLRVMAKPLGRADWERYFDAVPRDRPEAP